MNNLYKKVNIDGEIYTIIHEFGLNIALMNDKGIIRKQFKTNYDLELFMQNKGVK